MMEADGEADRWPGRAWLGGDGGGGEDGGGQAVGGLEAEPGWSVVERALDGGPGGAGCCERVRCGRWAYEREVVGLFRLCAACAGWIRYLRLVGGLRWGWSEEVTGVRV